MSSLSRATIAAPIDLLLPPPPFRRPAAPPSPPPQRPRQRPRRPVAWVCVGHGGGCGCSVGACPFGGSVGYTWTFSFLQSWWACIGGALAGRSARHPCQIFVCLILLSSFSLAKRAAVRTYRYSSMLQLLAHLYHTAPRNHIRLQTAPLSSLCIRSSLLFSPNPPLHPHTLNPPCSSLTSCPCSRQTRRFQGIGILGLKAVTLDDSEWYLIILSEHT